MAAAGLSLREMSAALAAASTTTKAGNPWSPSTVKLALERLELRGELSLGWLWVPLGTV